MKDVEVSARVASPWHRNAVGVLAEAARRRVIGPLSWLTRPGQASVSTDKPSVAPTEARVEPLTHLTPRLRPGSTDGV